MQLSTITKPDLTNCAKLYTQVFSSKPWNEAWTEEVAYERLQHFYDSKDFVGVLAEEAETKVILGFSLGNTEPFYNGTLFYLREMCTQAQSQNRGIGTAILHALEVELQRHNVKSIYLATDKAIPAARFYLKNGFSYTDDMGFYIK